MPKDVCHLVASMHSASWLGVRDSDRRVRTKKGVRQGCVLGAALCMAFQADISMKLQQRMKEAGIIAQQDQVHAESGTDGVDEVDYMDDIALLLDDDDPAALVEKVRLVFEMLIDIYRDYGLELNVSRGKSEVALALRGAGARDEWQSLQKHEGKPVIEVHGKMLPCNSVYKHLGSQVTANGSLKPDIKRRSQQAAAATKEMLSTILRTNGVSRRQKTNLVKSYIWSKLLYGVDTYGVLTEAEYAMLNGAYHRPLRLLDGHYAKRCAGTGTMLNLRQRLQVPSLQCQLVKRRATLWGKMLTLGCELPFFMSTLTADTGPKGWHEAVLHALQELHSHEQRFQDLPRPVDKEALDTWATFAMSYPVEWKLMVERSIWMDDSWAKLVQRADPEDMLLADLAAGPACPQCDYRAKNNVGLVTHLRRTHNILPLQNYVVENSICPACDGDFGTRTRCLRHLARPNQSCSRKLAEGNLQFLPPELLQDVEARMRADTQALRSVGFDSTHTDCSTVRLGTKKRK